MRVVLAVVGIGLGLGLALAQLPGCMYHRPGDCYRALSARSVLREQIPEARTRRECPCGKTRARRTKEKDCDGYPIYELVCEGEVIASGPVNCRFGRCFHEQRAGRCYE